MRTASQHSFSLSSIAIESEIVAEHGMKRSLRVLLIAEQCNPQGFSVPLVCYKWFKALSSEVDITLVTSDRHQDHFSREDRDRSVFLPRGFFGSAVYRLASWATKSQTAEWNWIMRHAFSYPSYLEFDRHVVGRFAEAVSKGEYEIVHALPPILPRYPVKIARNCGTTPFVLGPVNGGLPFPPGFPDVAKREYSQLNFLRALVRWVPGYLQTYRRASAILAGSMYTLEYLRDQLQMAPKNLHYMAENGIAQEFLSPPRLFAEAADGVQLLYVGRLVPYKQVDVLIHAFALLDRKTLSRCSLTLLGQGPQEAPLRALADSLKVAHKVKFCGWIPQEQTRDFYRRADIFCTASIREFGGAVVLEALACSLPCIVTDYGGIGEFVTSGSGYKIAPTSRSQMIREFRDRITELVNDPELRARMALQAYERAESFTWPQKAKQMLRLYEELVRPLQNEEWKELPSKRESGGQR